MITEDIASAIGLTGNFTSYCEYCGHGHLVKVEAGSLVVCKCGSVLIMVQVNNDAIMGKWYEQEEVKNKVKRRINDLPSTQ